jgi:succinyl-CoA synthetase beta subunit
MDIHEYQAMRIFAQCGIPVPEGHISTTPEEARANAALLGRPVVVKAQVLVGGRGKAGGIKLATNPNEAEEKAATILGMNIKGLPVYKVLVTPAIDIRKELYLGITIDRQSKQIIMMASAAGGMDIEEVAQSTPEEIHSVTIDPFLGLREY